MVLFIFRTIFRLVLLCRLKSGIQSSPPIPNLNRKNLPPVQREPSADAEVDGDLTMAPFPLGPDQPQSVTFEGRRSGRVVRSLHASKSETIFFWSFFLINKFCWVVLYPSPPYTGRPKAYLPTFPNNMEYSDFLDF